MGWTHLSPSRDYTPLPTSSPSSSTLSLAPPPPRRSGPPRARRAALVSLAACVVALLAGSLALAPEERLPEQVQGAVRGAKAHVAGAAHAVGGWVRPDQEAASEASVLEELRDEEQAPAPAQQPEPVVISAAAAEAKKVADEIEAEKLEQEDEVMLDDGALGLEAEAIVPDLPEVQCPLEVQERVGQASFWVVTEQAPSTYRIAPRDALGPEVPELCLSQAVFAARLVSATPEGEPEPVESQTVLALPAPLLAEDYMSYDLFLPDAGDAALPSGRYLVDVALEFGFYPGVTTGEVCGGEVRTCSPVQESATHGDKRNYSGERIEVLEAQIVELGSDERPATTLCNDLSSLSGRWSNLAYQPETCSLRTPTFPMPFVPAAPTRPLWIHLVGDSNSRNMLKHLTNSLGDGAMINAPKVRDSSTHNGTHAAMAFRYRDGVAPADESVVPDVIVTWAWWYEMAHSSLDTAEWTAEERGADFEATVAANRDELVSLIDADLASFIAVSHLGSAYKALPALSELAPNLRPHRTYLSRGSHGEELTLEGLTYSLDAIFSPTSSGLSRAARDQANLRFFTTTLSNTRYIPLARFPHQDLVRNNALIAARNAYAASRAELGGEGRVIDVEALTRGVVDDPAWLKVTHGAPDAVHFRAKVYDEWARLVWTDLMQGVEVATGDEGAIGIEATRRRWKRRVEWADEDDGEVDERL
ncbi:uncharacterized protein JCM10292_000865 [Rhodotorula paludigena]|uniref:uncharacterized protein n=1 Tax=Rhodotorula paludigena TaxID=86838 RepID=UPI00316C90B7